MDKYCNNSWFQIVEMLNSNAQNGINENECDTIRERYGTNKIDLPRANRLSNHIFNAIKQMYTIIYIIITVLLYKFEYYLFGSVTLILLLINLIATIVHNVKRDEEVGVLEKLNFADTVVIRDGLQKIIKSEELVMGDIVKITKDSLVPADIRIIKARDIKVSEKSITGEAFYKEKFESKITGSISSLADMKNILFKGSSIKSGDGIGIVIGTGNSTQLGRLLAMLTYASSRKHNFSENVEKQWSRYLLIYFIGIILVGLSFKYTGNDLTNVATALFALGCIPIALISVLTFKGVIKKFSSENIDIINFSVFNLIKDINILFLDKIGSISKNEMITKKIFINNEVISTEESSLKDITYERIVEISLICNNSTYNVSDDNGKGDLAEIAFLRYAAKKKIYKASIDSRNTRILEIPMDSDKRSLTVVSKLKNRYRANTRGNLDTVLDQCTHVMIDGVERELNDEHIAKIKDVDMNLSIEGLITQGFAYRNFTYEPSRSENIESNMVFVGIIALENPLEEDIESTINQIKDKAIVPILFTEESKLSAITNAKKARIIRNDNQVVAGIELDSLNRQELKDLLSKVRVFCRVNPEIKSQIVSLFIKDGHKVATTGETLGDLPSLNLSNVGICKGKASQIVKKVSEVYIQENYLDGFFKIRDFSQNFNKNIIRAFSIFYMIVLSELLILICSSLFGQVGMLNFWNVLTINGILFIPLSLIILFKNGREIKRNEMIIRASMLCGIVMILSYQVNNLPTKSFVTLIIVSIGGLLCTLFNSNVAIRQLSDELIMGLISVVIIAIYAITMTLINNIVINDVVVLQLIGFIIFFIIFEILYVKWQNSLMR